MPKSYKPKMLFTIFLTIVAISGSYAVLMPHVNAAITNSQQKTIPILNTVLSLNLSKYVVSTREYPQDSYMNVLPQENLDCKLYSEASKLEMLYTFTDGKLQMIHVLQREGSPIMTEPSANVLQLAKNFLNRYQNYSGNPFYSELGASLTDVNIDKNLTKKVANEKLQVTSIGNRLDFRWTYTLNGLEAPDKFVDLGYENGFLKFFIDTWSIYNIGSTDVNVSEEQAMNAAIAAAKNYSWPGETDNGTIVQIKNFNVTGAMMIETVFRSSLVADEPRNNDLLMLYPMRHVWVSLDKFYPGNVYGFNVYIWADTGGIAHIQERISTSDPSPELTATPSDITAQQEYLQPASIGTAPNGLLATLLPISIFVAVTTIIAKARLQGKGASFRRLSKISGLLLCLLTVSVFLLPVVSAYAAPPYGKSTIWGSESTGAIRNPPGFSWRKHPTEVTKQRDVAASVEQSFQQNGYSVDNYQGDTVQGLQGAILAEIANNEASYSRMAVVDFDHGNGATGIPGLPSDEFHYMFEDNYGTHDGPSYENPGPMLYNHGVFDKDIYQQTTGKTFFAFINTCNSAHVEDSYYGYYVSTQGLVDNSPYKARGMPFAWSHGIKVYPTATSNPPPGWMSHNGYTNPDSNNFVFIGFMGGSAALQQTVSGSWPYYETWVRQFFGYALIYDMTVNNALEHASASLGWNWQFDLTPLSQGFLANWPMYKGNPPTWQDVTGQGWMRVYGNGNLKLYQPRITLNANNGLSPTFYIDGYASSPGDMRVISQTHTVSTDSIPNYTFDHFTFNGITYYYQPALVPLTQDGVLTAFYTYNGPPPGGTENLTTYTEVDPNNDITVSSSRVTADTMRRDVSAYVYKDKGAGHFSGDFEHLIDVRLNSADPDGCGIFWSLWNSIGGEDTLRPSNNGVEAMLYRTTGGSAYYILLREWYNNANFDSYWASLSPGTTYYLKIARTGSTLTCKIYGDSARTNLIATLSVPLHSTISYQYIYATQSCASSYAPSASISAYCENLNLQENNPPPSTQDLTTYTEVDPNSDITVTSSRATVDTMRRDVTALVYKDKGAGYFSGNFEHLMTTKGTSADSDGNVIFWSLWNGIGGEDSLRPSYNGLEAMLYRTTDGVTYMILLREWYGNTNFDSYYSITPGTAYYLKIARTGSTLACRIYSDEARTNLLTTLSLNLHETAAYRYIYAIQSCASSYAPSATISGYCENLAI